MAEENQQERFRLEVREHLSPESLSVRPGNVLVAIHGPSDVRQVQTVLRETDTAKNDVVVLSVNPHAPRDAGAITSAEQVMDECETGVFSKVIRAAESEGKPAALLAVPGRDPYPLILQAADKLHSSRVVVTQSSRMSLDEQEEQLGQAWKRLRPPRPRIPLQILARDTGEEIRRIDFASSA